MKLNETENERQIALLKEAYELARKIEELQKKLKPMRDEVKSFMEDRNVSSLNSVTHNAQLKPKSGYLKWDATKLQFALGEHYEEFKVACGTMTASSLSLSINLEKLKGEKVG